MEEQIKREVSIEVFGTPDYELVLSVMAPFSALVKQFNSLVKARLATCDKQ